MLLKDKKSGVLIKVSDSTALIDPQKDAISGMIQSGEEEREPEQFHKNELVFPSGESLPRCWVDAEYQASKK